MNQTEECAVRRVISSCVKVFSPVQLGPYTDYPFLELEPIKHLWRRTG